MKKYHQPRHCPIAQSAEGQSTRCFRSHIPEDIVLLVEKNLRNLLQSQQELRELQKTIEAGVRYDLVFARSADKLTAKKFGEDVLHVPEGVSHQLLWESVAK